MANGKLVALSLPLTLILSLYSLTFTSQLHATLQNPVPARSNATKGLVDGEDVHVSHLGVPQSRAHRKHGRVGETAFSANVASRLSIIMTGVLQLPATRCCFIRLRVLVSAPGHGNVTLVYELYKSRRLGYLF